MAKEDVWAPEAADEEEIHTRQIYSITCKCENKMRVRRKHFGRMCRCTKCKFPIYVTFDNVTPPPSAADRSLPRHFKEEEVPVRWKSGDLFMELYRVREVLGEGGMGIVYKVDHRGWGCALAV